MGSNQEIKELVSYLDSDDVAVSTQVKQLIQENLYSSKDPSFLNALFDHYLLRRSDQLLEVITGINEHKSHQLFDRMNESLKQGLHQEMCTLLASIITKQPSWLYKIIGTQFFMSFLKFLKNEEDAILVMSGSLILSSLLPCVPSLIAPYLGEIMIIFYKFSSILLNQSGGVPDILLLHVQIGVYTLFHRIYSMYPNHLIAFMRENFSGSKQHDIVLNQVIKPMMNFVKFHPGLFTENVKSETDIAKWKLYQPHDIVAECQRYSLDPLDAVREATCSTYSQPSLHSEVVNSTMSSAVLFTPLSHNITSNDNVGTTECINTDDVGSSQGSEETDQSKTTSKSFLSSHLLAQEFSPSDLCGLSTPPNSRPQSPLDSMDVSAAMSDSIWQTGGRISLPEPSGEFNQLSSEQVPGLKTDSRKFYFGDRGNSLIPSSSSSAETSPVCNRCESTAKVDFAESSARRHGRLLHMAFLQSVPSDLLDEADRAYHSMPATPTQVLARPKPLGKDDSFYTQGISKAFSRPVAETRRVSPHFYPELRRKSDQSCQEIDNNKSYTSGTFNLGIPCDSGFMPIKASPLGGPDGSTQFELTQSTPASLIHAVQELQKTFLPKVHVDSRRGSAEGLEASDYTRTKSRTPTEILDEFIERGADVHSMELSRIPLTSQLDTDWTYFGGNSPADEASILKAQLKLLYLQLQYERHKCDLHVLRNRRLVGKVHNAKEVADEVAILKSRIQLLESELDESKASLRVREEENRNLKSFIQTTENHYSSTIQTIQEDKDRLKYEIAEVTNKNITLEKELQAKEDLLQDKNVHLLEYESEVKSLKTGLSTNTDVKLKADNLAKELLTQHDRYEQLREKFKTLSIYCNQSDESELLIESLKNENSALQNENQSSARALDASKLRIQELEVALGKKEITIRQNINDIESLRNQHSCETKALENKYKSLVKVCQSLEAYIMQLFAKLEEAGRQVHLLPTTSGYTDPATIERCTTKREGCAAADTHLTREILHIPEPGQESESVTSDNTPSCVIDSGIVTLDP